MSGHSSPVNGSLDSESSAVRLTVRKDLFPDPRIPELGSEESDDSQEDVSNLEGVKLETDFEQSIDEIANQKLQVPNGAVPPDKPRHRKHKLHSRSSKHHNGQYGSEKKRKKDVYKVSSIHITSQVKGGKNLDLVSNTKCRRTKTSKVKEVETSSDEEVLQTKCSVQLPVINVVRQSGKPYSHQLSQLTKKSSKCRESKVGRTLAVPCSGKPRSMLDICSKKKSKKVEYTATYQSQIVDTNTIKIKIRKTNFHDTIPITPKSVSDIGQRKSKKKKASSPVASESSGEEYNPSKGESAAALSVAAPKPKHPSKTKKSVTKTRVKSEKTERSRVSAQTVKEDGPQSPWGQSMPAEILVKIFEEVVATEGSLPTVIRLGKVCKLWHSVSCRPELWKSIDLAQYTRDKCKTDFKLVWLLENRLSHCHTLNIAHWKVCNIPWVLACIADYSPNLVELSLAGWNRLTPDQLYELMQSLPKLQRIDLSQTSETSNSGSCMSAASVSRVVEEWGGRLTHLTLANNTYTALHAILTAIASHCPKLEVLDISGARATSHPAAVPLEALQRGCPNIRVFRAANAQLVLSNATKAQAECAGWCQLEELSIAGGCNAERTAGGDYRLDDEALSRLVRGATRLRLLDLRGLQRLTDSGLVRVPAWDLQHLFLGGCNVIRQPSACLELICEKWCHSLVELDLSWASATRPLDDAVSALADSDDSKLRTLNLCGSSVSLEPVKRVLRKCRLLESVNLSSCRALPRGMKRHYVGRELQELKDSFNPEKAKTKDTEDSDTDSKKKDVSDCSSSKPETKIEDSTNSQESRSDYDSTNTTTQPSTDCKSPMIDKESVDRTNLLSPRSVSSQSASPSVPPKPDSSSTPRSESKTDIGSPHFSPVQRPDSQIINSPDVQTESVKSNSSWNLGQFRTTPSHKSEASPVNRNVESVGKMIPSRVVEQCSPTTSQETKQSPEVASGVKQDNKKTPSWNYGNYSPMPRQEGQYGPQRSPYSTQPSPAQPSPYSAQPSPYSTQPSPYSSQPSPYSAQPSPDTSQINKSDLQKSSSSWNTGGYSPMPKHPAPFSPAPQAAHNSPEPGLGVISDSLKGNTSKTAGQYSPMSRQDRIHQSPYSPRPNIDNINYINKKSPLMRQDCLLPSPDGSQVARTLPGTRLPDKYSRPVTKTSEIIQTPTAAEMNSVWGAMERFIESSEAMAWARAPFVGDTQHPLQDLLPNPTVNQQQPQQSWNSLPPFSSSVRRTNDPSDPWALGQFRIEPPHSVQNTFVEQSVHFDTLTSQMGSQSHGLNFLDDTFTESGRTD